MNKIKKWKSKIYFANTFIKIVINTSVNLSISVARYLWLFEMQKYYNQRVFTILKRKEMNRK